MKKTIDLNADVGERPEALLDGSEELLIAELTSVNIACGGHAGDQDSMRRVVELASGYGVEIGAHPSFPDRKNFGRVRMDILRNDLIASLESQIGVLSKIANELHAPLRHVKPHGALYNQAALDEELATAIGEAVRRISTELILVGLAGSVMLNVWKGMGFPVAPEAFGDRRYEADGHLRSRSLPDALLREPDQAAEQASKIVRTGTVVTGDGRYILIEAATICVHSDTPGAHRIARAIRKRLTEEGVKLKPLCEA